MNSVSSPKRGITLKSLRALSKHGFYNADTGTELSESEGQDYLHRLEQSRADRIVEHRMKLSKLGKTRSRGREWIPRDQVVFRRIRGRIVPFRKKLTEADIVL